MLFFVSSLKAAGAYVFPFIMGILSNWGLGLVTGYVAGVTLGFGVAGIFAGTVTEAQHKRIKTGSRHQTSSKQKVLICVTNLEKI